MKEKRTYSLTARERKERRRASKNEVTDAEVTEEKPAEQEPITLAQRESAMLASQKRSKSSALVVGIVVAVSLVLILTGILVPVISFVVNPYRGYDKVIARFNLSNQMVLEYVIDESEYDIAATNFIFLAKNKFFDNTLFFDAQSGWVRFGGYEDLPRNTSSTTSYENTHNHAQNAAYCEAFSALPTEYFRDENPIYKFNYKLKADTNGERSDLLNQIGVLSFLWDDLNNTDFQMSYQEQASLEIHRKDSTGNMSTPTLKATMVGYALDGPEGNTVNNLKAIAATAVAESPVQYGYQWLPPRENIYINSVRVYNLDDSKWRNFDFIDYVYAKSDPQKQQLIRYWNGMIRYA